MNRLAIEKRVQVVKALMEGVGVNATQRLTGVCKPAILKLLATLGKACFRFHDEKVRGVKPERVETDEVWSFVFCKEKSLRTEWKGTYGLGDTWLCTAIDRDSKIIILYLVGQRTPEDARNFMLDLSGRIVNTTTLSTDGLNCIPMLLEMLLGIGFITHRSLRRSIKNQPKKPAIRLQNARAAKSGRSSVRRVAGIFARPSSNEAI